MNKKKPSALDTQRRAEYAATANEVFVCEKCTEHKKGSEFPFDRRKRNGRRLGSCKECLWEALQEKKNELHRKAEQLTDKKPEPWTKRRATSVILYAAERAGFIRRPKRCQKCRQVRELQKHHPKGYQTLIDAITIEWVCYDCHQEIHRAERTNAPPNHARKSLV
jgi:hypothetical protein